MTQHIKALTTLTFLFTLACGGDGFGTNDDGSADTNTVQASSGGNTSAGGTTQAGGNAGTGGGVQTGGNAQQGGSAQQGGDTADAGVTKTDTMPKTDTNTQPGVLPKASEVLQYLTRVPPYVMFVTTGLKGDPILPRIRCGIFMPKIGDPCFVGGVVPAKDYEIYTWNDGGIGWSNDGAPSGQIVGTVLTEPDVLRFKIDRPALMFWPRPHQSPPDGFVKVVPKTLDDWILENSASLAGKTGSVLAAAIDALTQPPNIPGITCAI